MLRMVRFSAKDMENKGYSGIHGGGLHGSFYGIEDTDHGLVSLDGKVPFLLNGRIGKDSIQEIIKCGFCGDIYYIPEF